MTALRVLTLDLSYAQTGVARILPPPDGEPPPPGWNPLSVRSIRSGPRSGLTALDWMCCEVEEEFRWRPQLCAIEMLPIVHNNNVTYLAELHGAIKRSLYRHDIPVVLVHNQKLKMYATGSGSNKVEKAEVMAAVRSRYAGVMGGPAAVRTNDEADAAVMAAMCAHAYGQPLAQVPAENARAIRGVDWPSVGMLSSRAPAFESIERPAGALL